MERERGTLLVKAKISTADQIVRQMKEPTAACPMLLCLSGRNLQLGIPGARDMALSRLAKTGQLERVLPGLYVQAHAVASVKSAAHEWVLDCIAQAAAARLGAKAYIGGQALLRSFGIPARGAEHVYFTDCARGEFSWRSRSVKLLPLKPQLHPLLGTLEGRVVQGLAWANGGASLTPDDLLHVRAALSLESTSRLTKIRSLLPRAYAQKVGLLLTVD
jgi:hypothetical protein